ncbi:MAG: carbohydrate kinase family protein [Spirochaetaceae bacterium]
MPSSEKNIDSLINGVGCSLVDYLYTGIDFSSPRLERYLSRSPGDGGIVPGKLVFADTFAEFAGTHYLAALDDITEGRKPTASNLGGPAIVPLVHAAQLLAPEGEGVRYYGLRGNDTIGNTLAEFVEKTPVDVSRYERVEGVTPFTYVLSDPNYDDGNGERAFINNIGVAYEMTPDIVPDEFFDAPILLYGGTALVPRLHARLDELLLRGSAAGKLNVVATVYDFYNESKNPGGRWPIGSGDDSYSLIDLLITDHEEALRLSGSSSATEALSFFKERGVGAVVITHGANNVHLYAGEESKFLSLGPIMLPVSEQVGSELAAGAGAAGDTTGCGDNFCGGLIYALAQQHRSDGSAKYDLIDAARWAIVSGGFACFYVGGTYFEERIGEKRDSLAPYYEAYRSQISLK